MGNSNKRIETIGPTPQKKREYIYNKSDLSDIVWNSKYQKLYLTFDEMTKSLIEFDLQTATLRVPFEMEDIIWGLKLTEDQEKLVFITTDRNLHVYELKEQQFLKKFFLPCGYILNFGFSSRECESVILNSLKHGLFLMDLESGNFRNLGLLGFQNMVSKHCFVSPDFKLLYGKTKYGGVPATYNLHRGHKYTVLLHNSPNFVSCSFHFIKKSQILFCGGDEGLLLIIDMQSRKLAAFRQFKQKDPLFKLQSKANLVYGVFRSGRIVVSLASPPFSVLVYKRLSYSLNSICLTDQFLVLGGGNNKSLSFFDIPEAESLQKQYQDWMKRENELGVFGRFKRLLYNFKSID